MTYALHNSKRSRVLLLSGGTGAGHTMAARAIEEELERAGMEVRHVDAYAFVSRVSRWAYTHLHYNLLEFLPYVYGPLYEQGSRSRLLVWSQRPLFAWSRRKLTAVLRAFRPDVVVVTHPLGCTLAAPLKERWGYRLVVLTTDYRAHAFHVHAAVDCYCASSLWAARDLRAQDIPPEQIVVTGIPLRSQFDALPSKADARRTLGLSTETPVVLVSRGGMAAGWETVTLLSALLQDQELRHCQVVAILGQRARGYRLVSRRVASSPRLRIERFVGDMGLYLAAADLVIGKPGGLFSTETFAAGCPLVIYAPNEGIETANVERFVAAGAAVDAARSPERAVAAARELLRAPERRAQLAEAGRRLIPREGRRAVRRVVQQLVAVAEPQRVPA